jgi:uncharacterized protein (TIGR02996 family)
MTDASLLVALRVNPDDETHWVALASWLRDNGRDDEADVIRVFWPVIRDSLTAGRSLESTLALVRQNAKRLGRRAREIERRRATGQEPRG